MLSTDPQRRLSSQSNDILVPSRLPLLYRAAFQYPLVGIIAAVLVFHQLGAITLDEHESKAALSARTMLRHNEWLLPQNLEGPLPQDNTLNRWLVPINNGEPRLVKTPLAYWTMAAFAAITGKVDEWSARTSSAVCAILLAWLVLAIGRKMFSPRAALMAALMLVTSLGVMQWGRDARPEMLLCLSVAASMALFYFAINATSRRKQTAWMLAFWLAMGIANLSKEFVPLLLGLPLMGYLCWLQSARNEGETRYSDITDQSATINYRLLVRFLLMSAFAVALCLALTILANTAGQNPLVQVLKKLKGPLMAAFMAWPLLRYMLATKGYRQIPPLLPTAIPGVLLMLAMFVPWGLYMIHLFPNALEIFNNEVTARAAGTGAWQKPVDDETLKGVLSYFISLVTLSLPWILFLPGALAAPLMKRFSQHRNALVYLLLWAAMLFAIMTAVPVKRPHYILPILPAICLLMGFIAEDVFFNHRWISEKLSRVIGGAYGALALAAPLVTVALYLIAPHIKSNLDILRDNPQRFYHLMIVTVVAAIGGLVLLLKSRSGKTSTIPAMLLATVIVFYIGLHEKEGIWNLRESAEIFAHEAAAIIDKNPGPVGGWGDPQAKTVFYFDRFIPNARAYFVKWKREMPVKAAEQKLADWTSDPANVTWLFCYERHLPNVPAFFTPVLKVTGQTNSKGETTVFMLMHNSKAGSGVAEIAPASKEARP